MSDGDNGHMRIFDSTPMLRLLAPLAFVLVDPFAVAAWRVPNGMTATIHVD